MNTIQIPLVRRNVHNACKLLRMLYPVLQVDPAVSSCTTEHSNNTIDPTKGAASTPTARMKYTSRLHGNQLSSN